jgi:glycosyltransferase involved in cell wall biosynthesis
MEFAGLRVGLVGPLPPPAGGMANQTRQLAELLTAASATVALVQTNAPYRPLWVGRVPGLRAFFRLPPYLLNLWRTAGRSDVIHLMANSGWSWHLFAAPAIWVAWLRRVPVVVNYRGGEAGSFLGRSARTVRWSMAKTARLVVPSGFLREIFQQHGMAATIVPNVVDLQRFRPGEGAVAGAPHLVVARNLEAIYDNATALRAFAQVHAELPQARLTVAGTGPDLASLQALAAQLGVADAVHFAGRLDREAMAALYRQCTLSINPSLADNMPNSVLESLASGVPVVSTDVGGVPFLVQDGVTALLVKPGDAQGMAHAVLRLLRDPSLAQRLAGSGMQEVQRYTWAQVAPALSAVYRAAVQRTGS